MHNKYFPENEYHTPENLKRIFWDRISLGTSIYFNIKYIRHLLKYRKVALANKYDREVWAHSSHEVFKFAENCGGRCHITGFDHVDSVKDEPVIFICNHMGSYETMVFPSLIAPVKEVTFVVKESLTSNKIFGPVMRARNPITVGRSDSRQDLMKVISDGKQKLSEGISIVIFPQSTRTVDLDPAKFNSLGIKLAKKAGVRVIPIAIKTDFWANGKINKDLGYLQRDKDIFIKFHEPIEIKGTGKEEHQYIVDFIQKQLDAWK